MKIFKGHHDTFKAIFQSKYEDEKEINRVYELIENNLIKTKMLRPFDVIDLFDILFLYKNKYIRSYFTIFKKIYDEYQSAEDKLPPIFCFFLEKEYGIKRECSKPRAYQILQKLNSKMDVFSDNQVIKAIKNDDVKLFENLISKEGFDLNEIFKNTPIIAVDLNYIEICCYYGSMQCFMLLRSKFNCKITEKCLNYAFLNNNIKMINECLLDQKPGKDLMKYAIFSYNIDLVMFLINKYKMQIDPNDCILAQNIEAFIVQLEQTGDFDKYFQFTYRFNFLDLVKYFCPFVKDIDARDENGLSPIMHAIVYNKYELAELLVSNGSNVNGPFAEDSYILQMTVALGRFKFAELLVLNGANVNAVDKNGQYVVHYAAQANNKDIYKLLVSHGADLNVKDQNGRTAYDLAMGLGHKDLGKYLISLGFKKEEEEDRYHRAAKDMNGKNPLHVAVVKHDYKTVELLLKSGDIDINERDSYGLTAMFYALALGDMDIFKLLIRYGADVNMKYWY